ncbi:MAG: discoidin domain-containing protein, partial [Planctomycetota bacterium]
FVTVDSSTSVVNFDAATAASNAYATWVSETRDGETRSSERFGRSGHVYSGFNNDTLWDVQREVVVDNSDSTGIALVGEWSETAAFPGGFYDSNSLYSRDASASATFTPDLPVGGQYEVFVRWMNNWGGQDHSNHGRNVPITVTHLAGEATTTVNQDIDGGKWVSFGTYDFEAGANANGSVKIANDGSGRAAIADAVRFVLKSTTEEIPTSPGFAIQPATDLIGSGVYSGGSYSFAGDASVLFNDVESNGRELSVVSFEQGSGGDVSIAANGDWSYEAHPFFVGWDTFNYTVSNGVSETTGTVQVFVEDARDADGSFLRPLTASEVKEASTAKIEGVRVVEFDGNGRASTLLGPGSRADDIGVSGFTAHDRTGDGIHFEGVRDVSITFDLGGNYKLGTTRLWNYNQQDERRFFSRLTNRGATGLRVLVDTDADKNGSPGNFVLAKTVDLAEATGRNDYSGEVFDLEGVEARFVKLELVGNRSTVDVSALSEVEFRGELLEEVKVVEVPNVLVAFESSRINNDRPAGRTLGSGFNVTDNFHSNGRSTNWQSRSDDADPRLVYDLNDDYDLGSMRLWNVNHGPDLDRGAKTIEVSISEDNENFELLETISLARGTGASVYHGEVFDLSGVRARYVQLRITETHGATDGTGFAEVRFYGEQVVPLQTEIPVAAVSASSDFDNTIGSTINESGLTEDGLRHIQEDTSTPEFFQYIAARRVLTPTVDFELGRTAELTKFHFWNFASAAQTGFNFDRGIREMRVLTSENGSDYVDQGIFDILRGFT